MKKRRSNFHNEARPRERSDRGLFCPKAKKPLHTGVRTGCRYLICLSVCVCVCVTLNSSFLLIARAVRGRFPQTRYLWKRASNAWDVVFPAPSRGGRGRWADVGFVVCFGWGGIHFQLFRRSRAGSVDSVKGHRLPVNVPTENSLIPARCTMYCAPT